MWYLATGEQLFPRTREENQARADRAQLASMAILLGSPPQTLLAKAGGPALEFFNKDGSARWEVPHETLESKLASALERSIFPTTAEEALAFVGFIRRVLVWEDRKRPSASDLLKDPWIG